MHEFGLISEMAALAEREMLAAGSTAPASRLTLIVGKFSGASPEALRTAFELVAPTTQYLHQAELVIEEPWPVCRCRDCGAATEVERYVFQCPTCGGDNFDLEGGDDLRLDSIDIDDDNDDEG